MTLENGQGEGDEFTINYVIFGPLSRKHREVIETRDMTFLEYKLSKSANKRAGTGGKTAGGKKFLVDEIRSFVV